jgi:hypothetical protein
MLEGDLSIRPASDLAADTGGGQSNTNPSDGAGSNTRASRILSADSINAFSSN